MPRIKVLVSMDRSKNRAAIRNAPTLSPAAHAARIWLVLESTSLSEALNCGLARPGENFEE